MPRRPRTQTSLPLPETTRLKFDQKLVLNQWLLSLFEVGSFEALSEPLKDPAYEGFDPDNVSKYFGVLRLRSLFKQQLTDDMLRGYDENIVKHWQAITAIRNRSARVYPKYFQYLALLFTEIYLDRYFRDQTILLKDLNEQVEKFNAGKPEAQQVEPFEIDQLNKLALWMATGSGKTLIMHINIRQYQYYLDLHANGKSLNRVILLTPNEGLSKQHLDEFRLSGIEAELFSKEGRGLFAGRSIEILDIHKLREEMGEKTVAVDAFEANNLVLVDEGHRGTSGAEIGHWMKMRNRLCEKGFSFEYSATFGQAIKASSNKSLEQEYARCIIFDYSYKYFYRDGYGKDYQILNLQDDTQEDVRKLYLTACLLVYYQQLRLYRDRIGEFRPYLIEKPLWIFVGGSVNAVRKQQGREVSDVLDILLTLANFVHEKKSSVERIERLLKGKAGLLDPGGHEIFANSFAYLATTGKTANKLFDDILATVFNCDTEAALHVELLKGSEGELALKFGEHEPFGVINVGDAPSLHKLCEKQAELVTVEREFSGSLFRGLNKADSTINLLIGSKKFSEGWNSWRVSTMGLMNIGRTEGSEIIQLFGRGVRLKGFDFCLKRTRHIEVLTHPKHIELLETLNVFGIRADYMKQFKELLEEEGLPPNEQRVEVILPVINNLGEVKLRIVRLKDGVDFKKEGPKPSLKLIDEGVSRPRVVLDWYPRIQARRSIGVAGTGEIAIKQEAKLTANHVAFFDLNELFFELQDYKYERSWHNLSISKDEVARLLASGEWYTLYIPPEEMTFRDFRRVRAWQEIASALLKKYCEWLYYYRKDEYERPHLEYRELDLNDPNFIEEYRFLIQQSETQIIEKLKEVASAIKAGELKPVEIGANLRLFTFSRHLYEPLVYCSSNIVQVKPVALNEGEKDFVTDLRAFYGDNKEFFADKELYLLRNQSRGRGIGFFEAGNFHPDFILWILQSNRQYISFVDPKGLRNAQGPDDPKISFHKVVKDLENRLADGDVTLSSIILSQTPHRQISWWGGGMSEADFAGRNVLFRNESGHFPIDRLLRKVLEV